MNWYGQIVDIQPCLFNAAVDVYEAVAPLELDPSGPEFQMFQEGYEHEASQSMPHRVSGSITCRAGDAIVVLQEAFLRPHDG